QRSLWFRPAFCGLHTRTGLPGCAVRVTQNGTTVNAERANCAVGFSVAGTASELQPTVGPRVHRDRAGPVGAFSVDCLSVPRFAYCTRARVFRGVPFAS